MKKKSAILILFLFVVTGSHAQTMYEFSFEYPAGKPIACKLLFIDNNDGTGKARLRHVKPGSTDTLLIDFDTREEITESDAACGNRLLYKLLNPKTITGNNDISLPQFICFRKDGASNLYEPYGVMGTEAGCMTEPVKFNMISDVGQQSLTREFVLSYFKMYEPFYRSQFVTNNTKALTVMEQNTKMFLLFVCNVTDPVIGTADRKAMTEAINLFRNIKNFLGISTFVYDSVTGADFKKEVVLKKINNFFTPGPNDIVIFYYAGHGFRMPKDNRPGPYIDLRDVVLDRTKRYQDNSLSTEDILVNIRKKGARLNLIISESCNDTITKTNPMVKEPAVAGKKGGLGMNWSTQNCRDLFLNAMPTTILMAAASPYQLAISNPEFGGYFSTFFRNNLELNMGYTKTNVKWENIIEQTRQQAETKAGRTWCNDEKTVKCNRQRPFATILYGRF